ncbi:MAG TPA: DUF2141 domain-containing protein, partial [Caulobacter sp.]|nr:DUF2141 domain-containing protein [Caulobacter sp.]
YMEARSVLVGAMFATFATAGVSHAEGVARALTDQECAGRKTAIRLNVQVGALRSNAGNVIITVYPGDPSRFMAPRGKLARQRVTTSAPMSQACFWLPSATDAYAVFVFHDANGNKELDRGPGGMPIEGYGFSNDAPTKFGMPSFDAVRFGVKPIGETTIRIKVRYPATK